MGVGKTTVGQVLAERMGRQLVDSDFRIEQLTGRTVKQILAEDGVGELRRHEAAALFDALADREPRVIAAAGGVVLDDDNRRRLAAAEADVVWLTGDVTTLAPGRLPANIALGSRPIRLAHCNACTSSASTSTVRSPTVSSMSTN